MGLKLKKEILVFALSVVVLISSLSHGTRLLLKNDVPESGRGRTSNDYSEGVSFSDGNSFRTSANRSVRAKKRKIFLFWIDENPGMGRPGKYRYYYDIAYAINTQGGEAVEVCESTWRDKLNRSRYNLTKQEQYVYLTACYRKAAAYERLAEKDGTSDYEAIILCLFPTKLARRVHNDGGEHIDPFVHNLRRMLDEIGSKEEESPHHMLQDSPRIWRNQKRPCVTFVFMANLVFSHLTQKMNAFTEPFVQRGLLHRSTLKPAIPGLTVLASTWSPHAKTFQEKYRIPFFFCPFATDINAFNLTGHQAAETPWKERPYDVFLRWDTNPGKYRHRMEIDQLLSHGVAHSLEAQQLLEEVNVSSISALSSSGFMSKAEYLSGTASSKMAVSTIGVPDKADLLGTRYFEVQASGTTLLLSERPITKIQQKLHIDYGFIEGETYVAFSNITELVEKIKYYKKHSQLAIRIILNAQAMAARFGSWSLRGKLYVEKVWEMSNCCSQQVH